MKSGCLQDKMKYYKGMVLKGKWKQSFIRLALSFKYAMEGFAYAVKSERNFRIHLLITGLALFLGILLKISKVEWLFIIISIFGVLVLELVNSALERAVNLATDKIEQMAKQAKDMAAAAVFLYAIMAVIIGLVIFGPKLIHYIFY